ncbi:bacillithiol system redox-active protein YtxJ [Mesobacillus zeae]|uniref:Bacillithiol system redox-active protein YtxJ n=1 Tax=Mesobacillus zeae TaxID=1917180 RepID=A0A398B5R9_9BACI|nr:bacillithiol system redox-active protein YtxJ [Mesobacillus zeae]RID83106.1 bacillithiol system redox-active protein YtxJ [Mesobacillus zeae]
MLNKIETVADFTALTEQGQPFYLLKHSLTCPISQSAYEEFEKFSALPDAQCYYLAVQEARLLSGHIADEFQIKHESPQAIMFVGSNPVWHASHWKITESALLAAFEENK